MGLAQSGLTQTGSNNNRPTPMRNTNTASSPIDESLNQQELAMAKLVSELKSSGKLGEFYQARKDELLNNVLSEHSDTFQKIYGDLGRASASTNNAMYYYVRNNDLNTLETAIVNKSGMEAKSAQHDSQLAKRQFELNEWSANNKLDTLFVFQMILIALAVTGPIIYLNHRGLIPTTLVTVVLSIIYIAILLTIIIRAKYTNDTRDKRYWNRRIFANMGGPPFTVPTCMSPEGVAIAMNNLGNTISSEAQSIENSATGAINSVGNMFSNFGK